MAVEPDVPILGIDHIELHVGNAQQAAWTFERFGFTIEAYAGLETGAADRTSWLVRQGEARFVLTGALDGESPIAEHVRVHGDGVRDIAFLVPDAEGAIEAAAARGAIVLAEPAVESDEHGKVVTGSIHAYGEVRHTFIQRSEYAGRFRPGFEARTRRPVAPLGRDVGVLRVDHVVAAVPAEESAALVAFYRDVLGFKQLHHFDDQKIATEHSALMNKVMADGSGRIKIPIVEPGRSRKRGQVQEFLDYHNGPGVQHVALETGDVVASVAELSARGMSFLRTPDTYYDRLAERAPKVAGRIDDLRRTGVLADQDDEGYLLQIFGRSWGDRPTLFFEFIERHGSTGLGERNVRALYEAMEREQEFRGTL